jgi:hypothetical protein
LEQLLLTNKSKIYTDKRPHSIDWQMTLMAISIVPWLVYYLAVKFLNIQISKSVQFFVLEFLILFIGLSNIAGAALGKLRVRSSILRGREALIVGMLFYGGSCVLIVLLLWEYLMGTF